MPVEQVFVGLGTYVLDDVADSQDQLILNWRNPWIVVQFKHGARAQEVLQDKGGSLVNVDCKSFHYNET